MLRLSRRPVVERSHPKYLFALWKGRPLLHAKRRPVRQDRFRLWMNEIATDSR